MMVAWRERHREHVADRCSSRRLVLEYGSILTGGAAHATPRRACKATIFVRFLKSDDAGGSIVYCGAECAHTPLGSQPDAVVSEVVLNYNPDASDDDSSKLSVSSPAQTTDGARVDYAFVRPMRRGATCHLTVYWSEALGIAPLEIRHKLGRVPTGPCTRRIVVQLPAELPVLQWPSYSHPRIHVVSLSHSPSHPRSVARLCPGAAARESALHRSSRLLGAPWQ